MYKFLSIAQSKKWTVVEISFWFTFLKVVERKERVVILCKENCLQEFMSSASENTNRASHVRPITISSIQLAAFRLPFILQLLLDADYVLQKFCWNTKFFSFVSAHRDSKRHGISSRNWICWRSVKTKSQVLCSWSCVRS